MKKPALQAVKITPRKESFFLKKVFEKADGLRNPRLFQTSVALGFSIFVFFRLIFPTADVPSSLDWSGGIITDGPNIANPARMAVVQDNWKVLFQHRTFFNYPLPTILDYLVFKVIGYGFLQVNIIPLLSGLITALIYFYILFKLTSRPVALAFLLIISLDYRFLFYNRISMAENIIIGITGLCSLFFYQYNLNGKNWFLIGAGILAGMAVFFCKPIALPVFLALVATLVLRLFGDQKGQSYRRIFLLVGSFGLVGFCYWFGFHTPSREILGSSYYANIAQSPDARLEIKGVGSFLQLLFSFGLENKLFYHIGIMALLAFLSIAWISKNWKEASPFEIYLTLLVIFTYLILFPWHYRPLRYQVILIPPLLVLGCFFLHQFLGTVKISFATSPGRLFWGGSGLVFFWYQVILFISLFCQLHYEMLERLGMIPFSEMALNRFIYSFFPTLVLAITVALLTVGFWIFMSQNKKELFLTPNFRKAGVTFILLLSLSAQVLKIIPWLKNPNYGIYPATQDARLIINSGARMTDMSAAAYCLNTDIDCISGGAEQMIPRIDSLKITHFVTNPKQAHELEKSGYPTYIVAQYEFCNRPIVVVYLPRDTLQYQPTSFEKGKIYLSQRMFEKAQMEFEKFIEKNSQHAESYFQKGLILIHLQQVESGIREIERAIMYNPSHYQYLQQLGAIYYQLKKVETAKEYLNKALKLKPENEPLRKFLEKI